MMKFIFAGVIILLLAVAGTVYYIYPTLYGITPDKSADVPKLNSLPTSSSTINSNTTNTAETAVETIVAEGLDTPWAIAFLPDGNILVTERKGTLRFVDKQSLPGEPGKNGNLQSNPIVSLSQVKEIGEGGLMGIALHPNFSSNNYIYLYYTYDSQGEDTRNRVVRMKYINGQLSGEQIIVDNIPGASNHNGGRIKFGPDNYLYITTGDAQEPSLSQDTKSLAGKILRVTDEGKPAPGNPFNSEIFSYGHRNPQGIAWDGSGSLWETEHGPSGGSLGTGNDEVNFIIAGNNYGWPEIQGDETRQGMVTPAKNSTPSVAWAPGGAAVIENSLFFVGLRGQALYQAILENDKQSLQSHKIIDFKEHFKGKYGRIREAIMGPDGMLYITTSNRDGRGVPGGNDDRIIRINTSKL